MIATIGWPLGVLAGYSLSVALTPGPGEGAAATPPCHQRARQIQQLKEVADET